MRLDDLVDELGIGDVGLVKIDVQGAEERVLRGAQDLLARHRPVLFVELDPKHLKRQGSNASAVLSTLRDHSYEFATLGEGSRTGCTMDAVLRLLEIEEYLDVLCLPTP